MIEVTNLAIKHYGKITLTIPHLVIHHGEKICLIGKSGSGKTTLLECLFKLRKSENEENIALASCSYSPQKSDLIDNFTVKTNILMGRFGDQSLIKNIISILKNNTEVELILKNLHLADKKNELVKYLSGGEKQRVLIARAIYEDKKIALFDEPTSALDIFNSQNAMRYLMASLAKSTVICSIHDLSLVDYFNKVLVLSDGEIVFYDEIKNINKDALKGYFYENKTES